MTSNPAEILGIAEEEWSRKVAEAEEAGLAPCCYCGFEQYRNHNICVKCGFVGWDYYEVDK